MHGVIFIQLKDFVVKNHGERAWDKMLELAGLQPMALFLPSKVYPDEQAVALVKAACELTGAAPEAVLEGFGSYIAPVLMQTYGWLVKPEWKTLDLLMNVEDTIHKIVRIRDVGAEPPELSFQRVDDKTLAFHYESKRQMASLAIGIIKGVADHYGEKVSVSVLKTTPEATEMLVQLQG